MLATPLEPYAASGSQSLHPPKIVVLGDSLVYGFGDPEGGGWVERLRRRSMALGSMGPVFYNLGVRGDGVRQVCQRLEHEFRYRGELRNRVPDLIVLSVGVNDSARVGKPLGRSFTDYEIFKAEMDSLLQLAKGLCPVLFVGMTPVDERRMPFADVLYYSSTDQWHYKEATRLACAVYDIPYLDTLNLWLKRGDDWWRSRLLEDGLHPNVAGYQALLMDILAWDAFHAYLGAD
jgi:lysophospholipase L1-like esterase